MTQLDLDAIETRANAATRCPEAVVNGRQDGQHTWTGSLTHLRCELCGFTRPRGERAEEATVMAAEIRRLRAQAREYGELAARRESELIALRAKLAREERAHGETIDERDHFHDMADKLAYAVAPEEVIGEHSSMNCPWENALDLITPMAEVEKLREELERQTALAEQGARANRELSRVRAVVAAVIAEHEKGEHNGLAICLHCAQLMFPPPETGIWSESAYPCATLRALGITEDPAVEAHVVADDSDDRGRTA
ncbi:hypothetical protein SAMN04490357_1004 [Streptomyces misionensis]|uniref:Uncharacterized protein n=1 Tax=Streptomyces misionensis TaxID=67331 RepID=A0A1H4P6Y2_9ACTN|nr:hypothetical protein [Streptomyces misionensis]SEC03024.1 hypothetical protein SAMN04490357_1004 [Streptomyces misionensis]